MSVLFHFQITFSVVAYTQCVTKKKKKLFLSNMTLFSQSKFAHSLKAKFLIQPGNGLK